MENYKSVNLERANTRNESSTKNREKIKRKKKKKIKRKEKGGVSEGFHRFFPFLSKQKDRENSSSLTKKSKKKIEGIIFKELKSDFNLRKLSVLSKQKRKNENLSKMSELEKLLMAKKLTTVEEKSKPKKKSSHCYKNAVKNIHNTQYLLSPIRPESDVEHETKEYFSKKCYEKRKLDLEFEFEKFSLQYEEAAKTLVLLKLPKTGVYEDALETLREKQIRRLNDNDFEPYEFEETPQNQSISEYKKIEEPKELLNNFELKLPLTENLFSERFFAPDTDYFFYENLTNEPLGKALIEPERDIETFDHRSFMFGHITGPNVENMKINLDYETPPYQDKQSKTLILITPPIQFYRRNMF